MLPRLLASLSICLFLLDVATAAEAPGRIPLLFVEAPVMRRAVEAPLPLKRGETRNRAVRIDPTAVAARLLPADADQAPDRAEALPPEITVRFFADTVATFRRVAVEPLEEGGIVWTGDRADGIGTLTLVVEAGRVTGTARLEDRRFRITATGVGTALVAEIDLARLPRDRHVAVKLPARKAFDWTIFRARRPPSAEAAAVATIDLLVGYSPAAVRASPNLKSEVRVAVAVANRAFKDSGIRAKLRIVGWHELAGYVEQPGSDTLGATVTAARFASLRDKREAVGADLVTVVERREDYCGIGYILDGRSVDAAYGYSVMAVDCVQGATLAHEIGHNLGLNHDRYQKRYYGPGYNFGYTNVKVRARDIMSYPDECLARFRQDCATPDLFSSPLVSYRGGPMGIAAGQPNAADGARKIRSAAPVVAKFRAARS
jgi:hypothetical protein